MFTQLESLINELQTDPAQIGYADKSPHEVLALLNAPDRDYKIEPATPDVANFLVNHGMMAALMVAESKPEYAQFPDNLKVAVKSVLMLNSSNTPTMNFNNAFTNAAVQGIVAAGLWQQSQVDELIETLAARKRSRAVEMWNQDVEIADVTRALWPEKFAATDAMMNDATRRYDALRQGIDPDAEVPA